MKTLLVLAALVLATHAFAGPEPWAVGVTDAQKQAAKALLDEGNARFLDKQPAAALDKYRQAIAQWDHPAIRFNMVRCLIQLEKPEEAAENLARALAYGAAPLDDAVYTEALNYQKLLASQIGELEISCKQSGVKISFDGQVLLTCPGTAKRRAVIGRHLIVGTKDGFMTKTTEVVVLGGKQQQFALSLVTLEAATKVTHRWPAWVPWSVFGGGFAVAGLGGLIQLQASARMDSYDRQVARNCSLVHCDPDDPTMLDTSDKHSAERLNAIAIGVMSVGAGVAFAGGVMLYLNRGRTTTIDATPQQGGAVVSVGGRF